MATETERRIIQSHLDSYEHEIAESNGIDCRILAARDYGSRARNLDSHNSDYDVMFVYARGPTANALNIGSESYEKTIPADENNLDREIELSGWSLSKFVGGDGLTGSNPTAIEFALSNEQYYLGTGPWSADFVQMLDHAVDQFKPYALINHYRSMAASNYGKYIEGDYKIGPDYSYQDLLDLATFHDVNDDAPLEVREDDTTIGSEQITLVAEKTNTFSAQIDTETAYNHCLIEPTTTDVTVKRYLTVVQSLMRARYVEETHRSPSPMDFGQFLRMNAESDWLSDRVYAGVGDLIARKKDADRPNETSRIDVLDSWIESELSRDVPPQDHVDRQPNRRMIMGYAQNVYDGQEFDR